MLILLINILFIVHAFNLSKSGIILDHSTDGFFFKHDMCMVYVYVDACRHYVSYFYYYLVCCPMNINFK